MEAMLMNGKVNHEVFIHIYYIYIYIYSLCCIAFDNRILHICHGVLYKQLCAWMIHGLSRDPHREFFIQRVAGGTGVGAEASKTSQEDEGELGIMGLTGRQMQAMVCTESSHAFLSMV